MGTRFSRMRRTGTRRGTRCQIPATEQTRAATTEACPTPASVTRTETDVAGTLIVGHARHQIPAPEQQTRVASISEACPTPTNITRAETDTAGTRQGSSQPGEC